MVHCVYSFDMRFVGFVDHSSWTWSNCISATDWMRCCSGVD